MTKAPQRDPIWKTIYATLFRDIAEQRYSAGDKLPTEAALAQRFGVNRHTVRRALAQLADEGVVLSRRGAGVFVTHQPTDYPLGRRVRFHQSIRAAGHLPAKEILIMETRMADAREAEALRLPQQAQVHCYEGLSLSDGQPIALFRSVFPAARFPDLPEALVRLRSVTEALKDQGLPDYTRAWTRLNAKLASPTQARHLQIREAAPVLRAVSVNVDADGTPVEYGRSWFAGDRITLTLADI